MDFAVFGDSLMGQAGDYLGWFLGLRGHNRAEVYYWPGTAWCDWRDKAIHHSSPARIAAFSGNMITPCTQGRGSKEAVYAADVEEFVAIQVYLGRRNTWLMSTPGPVGTTEAANWTIPILQATAAKYAAYGVRYYDAAHALASAGSYPMWVPCDSIDVSLGHCFLGLGVLREDDGAHLRPAGARRWGMAMAGAVPPA